MKINHEAREKIQGYLFVLPAIIFMLLIIGYPIVYNIIIGFQNVDVMTIKSGTKEFVGFDNYIDAFKTGILGLAMKNTFIYTAGSLIFQFTIGFALALLFSKKFPLAKVARGTMLISYILPVTVTALLFKFMFSEKGIINDLLLNFHFIKEPVKWLLQGNLAIWALIIANTWIGIPFNMILLTTGLNNIPEEVYESCKIDGANSRQQFFLVTVPLLKSSIMSVLILGFIYTFKVFDLIFVMTNGGPVNATQVLSTFSYKLALQQYSFSKGAAVANVLTVALLIVSVFYLKLIKDDEVM